MHAFFEWLGTTGWSVALLESIPGGGPVRTLLAEAESRPADGPVASGGQP